MHYVWNETLCCVEVAQSVETGIPVQPICGSHVVMERTTKTGTMNFVGFTCPTVKFSFMEL